MCTMRKPASIALIALFSGVSAPVHAQTTVRITDSDCARLVTHVAAADVNYRPGVDVNGNAVAPADLNAQPRIAVPEVISIPVTIDLATDLGIDTPFLARPTVGEVRITRDGRVSFNGQPIGDAAQHALAKRCQQVGPAN